MCTAAKLTEEGSPGASGEQEDEDTEKVDGGGDTERLDEAEVDTDVDEGEGTERVDTERAEGDTPRVEEAEVDTDVEEGEGTERVDTERAEGDTHKVEEAEVDTDMEEGEDMEEGTEGEGPCPVTVHNMDADPTLIYDLDTDTEDPGEGGGVGGVERGSTKDAHRGTEQEQNGDPSKDGTNSTKEEAEGKEGSHNEGKQLHRGWRSNGSPEDARPGPGKVEKMKQASSTTSSSLRNADSADLFKGDTATPLNTPKPGNTSLQCAGFVGGHTG